MQIVKVNLDGKKQVMFLEVVQRLLLLLRYWLRILM